MLLVFDWDGTLIDSTGKIVRCLQEAARRTDLPVLPAPTLKNIIGLGLPEAIAQLYPDVSPAAQQLFKKAYSEAFVIADARPCALYEGVEQGLQQFRSSGHKLAVATGKSRRGLDRVLGNLQWQQHFDATRCADETASKPHPRMLLELIAELEIPASEVFMVGDTEYDLLMAAKAGVRSVAVSYGAHDASRLQKHKPVAIIDSFSELDRLFN